MSALRSYSITGFICFISIFILVEIYTTENLYLNTKNQYKVIENKMIPSKYKDGIGIMTNVSYFSDANKTLSSVNSSRKTAPSNQKEIDNHLILYWDRPWKLKSYGLQDGAKIGLCTITYNRSRLHEAKAVVFHFTAIKGSDLPWKHYRNPNQIFVWWNSEPPAVLNRFVNDLDKFDGFFNWTWTYRRDADIVSLYSERGAVLRRVKKGKYAIDEVLKSKKKLALTLASNCDQTDGGKLRLKYGDELIREGLKLDRIGRCFGNSHLLPRSDKRKVGEVIKQYKFYLAFENAIHCRDYITEKFWNSAILNDAVPVVLGPYKIDYMRLSPIDSFIHVEDFESPRKLAEYLNFLDKNVTEYRKYFRWRENENMTDDLMVQQIREKYPDVKPEPKPKNICEKISENSGSKVIQSLLDEFAYNKPPECN